MNHFSRVPQSGHLNSYIYDRLPFGLPTNCEEEFRDQLEWMSTRSWYTSVQIPVYGWAVPVSISKHTRVQPVHPQMNESRLALLKLIGNERVVTGEVKTNKEHLRVTELTSSTFLVHARLILGGMASPAGGR